MIRFFLSLLMVHALQLSALAPEFVVIVPSYNNEQFVEWNLESLLDQRTSRPYQIIIINDASTDTTGLKLEVYKHEHNLPDEELKIIHNVERKGALYNIYRAVHEHCQDHQIVVHVDGDDALAHHGVLERLEQIYADPHIWMTYGSFLFFPNGPDDCQDGTTFPYSAEDLCTQQVRKLPFLAQHLRTFRVSLFKKIKVDHLMRKGEFLAANADMATMIPMHEMCAPATAKGRPHSVFVDEIMYLYNWANPISDHRVGSQASEYTSVLQEELEEHIRALPAYEPLTSLD